MTRPVLIAIHTNTFFVELFRLVRLLMDSGKHPVLVMFVNPYPTFLEDAKLCLQLGIPCLDNHGRLLRPDAQAFGPERAQPALGVGVSRFAKTLKKSAAIAKRLLWLSRVNQLFPVRFLFLYQEFRSRVKFINRLFDQQTPALLVLGGDMVGYDTPVFIKVAHQRSIKALLVPSTMSNGLEQAEAYFYDPNHNLGNWINRSVAKSFPRWVFEHRGRKLLRVPAERILLMEHLGLAPPLPWIFNSGYADAIAIESERMRQYYLACGLPAQQLRLIGSLADDVMVMILESRARVREDLYEELGLPKDRPMVLSALPPDFLYMPGGRPECDFKTYPELVAFWIRSIARVRNFNVVVCLHPSARYEDYQYFESLGVKIARRGTADLVPLCDIYIASVSSTIRWAIACGTPVINYDVYRYRYTDYLGLEGVLILEKKAEFESAIVKLAEDAELYNRLKAGQKAVAHQWGMFDGKVGQRMLALIDEYTSCGK